MRGRHYISVLIIALMFTIGLITAIGPAKAAYVKVYVNQPSGYIPFVAPDGTVTIDIYIETSGITDGAADSIVAWGMDVQVDPNVLDINLTEGGGFPPAPAKAAVVGAEAGYVMYDFSTFYGDTSTNLLPGTSYPATGFWDDIAEGLLPTSHGGIGDYMTGTYTLPPKMVTLEVTSKSDTQPCLIDLVDVEYVTPDGVVHPVDIVLDGFYGEPPTTMSYQGSLLPPGDPTDSNWHEIYPNYCKNWQLIGWIDNGDGDLTASDQIDMVNETGWIYHYHVDKVTVTIHFTFKPDDVNPTGEEMGAEPFEPNTLDSPILDPIGSTWHQIYPEYSREFVITSWTDNGDDEFSISDQFDFEYFGEGVTHWAHLDDITTDIILSQKGEPEPPVPEFPLGAAVEVGLIVAVAYIWWTRRRRLKEVL